MTATIHTLDNYPSKVRRMGSVSPDHVCTIIVLPVVLVRGGRKPTAKAKTGKSEPPDQSATR